MRCAGEITHYLDKIVNFNFGQKLEHHEKSAYMHDNIFDLCLLHWPELRLTEPLPSVFLYCSKILFIISAETPPAPTSFFAASSALVHSL